MDRISYNSLKIINFFENLNPKTSGVIFSTLIHLIILLFMVGLPNFFSSKEIYVPNVIPIEILNVDENTNLKKSDTEKPENKNKETITKQKKFNSSDQLEVKKNIEINKTEIEEKTNPNQPVLEMKQTPNLEVKETKKVVIKEKEILEVKKKVETIKTDIIKPKLKPKPKIINNENVKSDLDVETNIKDKPKLENDKTVSKPKPKPEKDFSIASMLKDLRNEKTNIVQNEVNEEVAEVDNKIVGAAIIYNRFSTWKGKTLHLEDLVVTKKMRGQGIGSKLLDKVILHGKESGAKRISWNVIDWNTNAIEFYKNRGAEIVEGWRIIHLSGNNLENYIYKFIISIYVSSNKSASPLC